MLEKLAILDAGAQYGKVIDRRIRELNVETEILPMNTSAEELKKYKGAIITGGPESVYGDGAPEYDHEIFNAGVPILGICYGQQLMNYVAGGTVEKKPKRNDGDFNIEVDTNSKLFTGMNKIQSCLFTHGDGLGIDEVADGFKAVAQLEGLAAAIENEEKKLYGVQFHPEVDRTPNGKDIFHNFLYNVCGFDGSYTMEDRVEKAVKYIQDTVGEKKVMVLVSGGVDSTVCAALLHKALGPDRIYAVHVDNGFMRKDESAKVKTALEKIGLELDVIDASEEFYNGTTDYKGNPVGPLKDTAKPEEKRVIIGDTFMKVAQKAIDAKGWSFEDCYLAQGTLRPDLIESASKLASGGADVIKTHHNDTPLVREWRELDRIIEPLKDYHKDEVRELGKMLGLPKELIGRQPFPGPGLGIRIICADIPHIQDDFDSINEQLRRDFWTDDIKSTLLPIQTVGVQGDGRSYSYLVGLSGNENWNDLFDIAKEIPRSIHQVNRIAYIFGNTIEGPVTSITPTLPTPDAIYQLQEADDIVNQVLIDYKLIKTLSQVPVVSFPVNFGIPGNRSIAIRTFITNDFMTGVPAIPGKEMPLTALEEMIHKILGLVPRISRVAYDLTAKPPGTTEWE